MQQDPFLLTIDLRSEIPAYKQIADALRHALVNVEIHPGDVLPPVRQLAADLGIHFNTVAEAYRVLAEEGWLDLKRGRGATVLQRNTPPRPSREEADNLVRRLRQLIAEFRANGLAPARIARELRVIADGLE